MIALILPHLRWVYWVEKHVRSASREVDGPFRLVKGMFGGETIRIFHVSEGSDATYSCVRLAERRGAKLIIPVTEVAVRRVLLDEFESEIGSILPISESWDLSGLGELLRHLPESADHLPAPLTEFSVDRLWQGETGGLAVGTVPFPTGNPYLLKELGQRHGISAFDHYLSGAVDACAETKELTLRPLSVVGSILTRFGRERAPDWIYDERFYEHFKPLLLGQLAESVRED